MTDFVGFKNYDDVLTHRHFRHRGAQQPARRCCLARHPAAARPVVRAGAGGKELGHQRRCGCCSFVPYMLAEVAAGLIWRFVYDGDYGLVPAIGDALGQRHAASCSRDQGSGSCRRSCW